LNGNLRGDLLDNDRTYYFSVTAISTDDAESTYFEEISAVPMDEFPPQEHPEFIDEDTIVGVGYIELHWTEVEEADSYILSYGLEDGSGIGYYGAEDNVDKDTSIIINGLTSGSTYYFGIQSVDASGNESVNYGTYFKQID